MSAARRAARALAVALLLAGSLAPIASGQDGGVDETLRAFVGDWDMALYADPASFGDRGGRGTGIMRCRQGPLRAWVDCELDSTYQGLGRYLLKIVLYPAGSGAGYGAFVTNSFGGGRLYEGRLQEDGELVFVDAWPDPARRWQRQRTAYRFHDPDRISFEIEVANGDTEFVPHSSGTYRRR